MIWKLVGVEEGEEDRLQQELKMEMPVNGTMNSG